MTSSRLDVPAPPGDGVEPITTEKAPAGAPSGDGVEPVTTAKASGAGSTDSPRDFGERTTQLGTTWSGQIVYDPDEIQDIRERYERAAAHWTSRLPMLPSLFSLLWRRRADAGDKGADSADKDDADRGVKD